MSRIRNRVIVRVLRELGLVEEWGTGYGRILQDCQDGGYPLPEWRELGSALRVSLQPHPVAVEQDREADNVPSDVPLNVSIDEPINETVNETVNARQRWFIEQIAAGQGPDWSDLAQRWGVSRT